jgi:hypothetical protein
LKCRFWSCNSSLDTVTVAQGLDTVTVAQGLDTVTVAHGLDTVTVAGRTLLLLLLANFK